MKKRIIQALTMMIFTVSIYSTGLNTEEKPVEDQIKVYQKKKTVRSFDSLPAVELNNVEIYEPTEEEIEEENRFGEMELVAQLVQAEAGNQDLTGKRYVVDVVLNRRDDPRFPDTVEGVIFQKDPVQFSVTVNGRFEEAGWTIDEETYQAVLMEYESERLDSGVLYFNNEIPKNGKNPFKYGDHWFSY